MTTTTFALTLLLIVENITIICLGAFHFHETRYSDGAPRGD
ncbi:MAG: hypothetical protein WA972_12465 [Rhodococcus qingshengii]